MTKGLTKTFDKDKNKFKILMELETYLRVT